LFEKYSLILKEVEFINNIQTFDSFNNDIWGN